jgi:hypothetical protein
LFTARRDNTRLKKYGRLKKIVSKAKTIRDKRKAIDVYYKESVVPIIAKLDKILSVDPKNLSALNLKKEILEAEREEEIGILQQNADSTRIRQYDKEIEAVRHQIVKANAISAEDMNDGNIRQQSEVRNISAIGR